MADEGQIIRSIDWKQAFPFTHIFRAFRIAIHPSKLVLGLLLLISIYAAGRLLDAVWPIHHRAVPHEVAIYEDSSARFDKARDNARSELEDSYAQGLVQLKLAPDMAAAKDRARNGELTAEATRTAQDLKKQEIESADKSFATAKADIETSYNASHDNDRQRRHDDALTEATAAHDASIVEINDRWRERFAVIESIKGEGLFRTFFSYEVFQFSNVVESVLNNQWVGGAMGLGVTGNVYRFIAVGPVWLLRVHTIFAIVFGLLFLAAWSLFGGAISRIAAIHVARDEKISVRQAINFAVGKFLSFASAPIIPLLIVTVVGLVLSISALVLGNIPFIGPIIVGAFFILALLAGFVMTLVILGTIGGFNLMYPTVAVEGSDSFDAISRSFSYIYARPWRMLFYTAVAVAYGALTYLFIKLFITVILVLTHFFVNVGIVVNDNQGPNHPLFQSMWPDPATSSRLTYTPNYDALNWGPSAGAALVSAWVYLLIGLLGAFAISFYFSANTIIYFLMRHELDATELDDVYLEQAEDDFGEPPAGQGFDASPKTAVGDSTTAVVVTPASPADVIAPADVVAPASPAAPADNPPAV